MGRFPTKRLTTCRASIVSIAEVKQRLQLHIFLLRGTLSRNTNIESCYVRSALGVSFFTTIMRNPLPERGFSQSYLERRCEEQQELRRRFGGTSLSRTDEAHPSVPCSGTPQSIARMGGGGITAWMVGRGARPTTVLTRATQCKEVALRGGTHWSRYTHSSLTT